MIEAEAASNTIKYKWRRPSKSIRQCFACVGTVDRDSLDQNQDPCLDAWTGVRRIAHHFSTVPTALAIVAQGLSAVYTERLIAGAAARCSAQRGFDTAERG